MKNFKRIIAGLLALSLLFLCTACMTQGEKEDEKTAKWVLVDEKTFLVGSDGEKLQSEIHYEYDSYGRVNNISLDSGTECSDFRYDNNGNVISYTSAYYFMNDYVTYNHLYEYDSNNKLLKQTISSEDSVSETEYQYNEYGDKVYEKYHYKRGSYDRTETMHYALSYDENSVLIYSEVTRAFSDIEGTNYWLDKYVYDANGNRIEEYQYIAEDDYSGDGGEKIEYSGKKYVLQYIKYYTYEQREFEELDIISDTGSNSSTSGNNSFEKEETTTDPYNGFPAPIELKLVGSNEKTSIKDSTDVRFDIKSLHMITDTDGYNYLVLNYSITNLTSSKISLGSFAKNDYAPPKLKQNYSSLERYYNLSDECKAAYDEIVCQDYIPTELRPGETRSETCVYEVYDTESDIVLMITPISYVSGQEYDISVVRLFSF